MKKVICATYLILTNITFVFSAIATIISYPYGHLQLYNTPPSNCHVNPTKDLGVILILLFYPICKLSKTFLSATAKVKAYPNKNLQLYNTLSPNCPPIPTVDWGVILIMRKAPDFAMLIRFLLILICIYSHRHSYSIPQWSPSAIQYPSPKLSTKPHRRFGSHPDAASISPHPVSDAIWGTGAAEGECRGYIPGLW